MDSAEVIQEAQFWLFFEENIGFGMSDLPPPVLNLLDTYSYDCGGFSLGLVFGLSRAFKRAAFQREKVPPVLCEIEWRGYFTPWCWTKMLSLCLHSICVSMFIVPVLIFLVT